ncbi:MAG: CehA/McbA family metallohydrolase [Clostridia bacterium]|nr:CehA/McbA family metallohydrolase [Clostridia bacterium]
MKKALALILSLVMVFCMIPIVASADSTPLGQVREAVLGGSTASYTVTGQVIEQDGNNVYLQDDTGGLCVRFTAPITCNLGDTVTATGEGYIYNTLPQLSNSVLVGEVVSGTGPITPTVVTIPELSAHLCEYVQLRGVEITEVYDGSGSYTNPNVTVTDGTNSVQVYRAVMDKVDGEWEFKVGDKVNITAAVSIYSSTYQLRNTVADEWEEYVELVAKPTLTPDGGTVAPNSTVTIACTTEGATIYYRIDEGEYAEYTAPIVLTASCTVSAYAEDAAGNRSETASASFYVSDGSAMNIVEALAAGTVSEATVYGQLVYRFGNYGGLNSSILQYKHTDGEIYGLQVYNSLDSYTDATATPVEIGDWVVITGALGPYGNVQQMQSLTVIEKAPAELEGEDVTAAQVYESLAAVKADKANLLSEYVLVKNIKLGAYNDNGSTTVTDPTDSSITMPIYRAADYTKWHAEGDVVDMYCVVSAYGSTDQFRNGSIADYVKTVADTEGPIITLPETFLDAQILTDFYVSITVEDYSGVDSVKLAYTIDGNDFEADMVAGADNAYTYTIPAAQVTGGSAIAFTVTAVDKAATPNNSTANGSITIVDLPQIIAFTPASNFASGDDKRPVVSVTFANVGNNPTITMTLNGEAVTPVISGNTATYTPAADMADGKYTVTVKITRADSKEIEQTWSFYVGEAQYAFYFGQLHSHTAEYSDGSGTLEQAFEYAKYTAKNVDFLAVTDHSNYFDTSSNLGDMTDPTKGTMTSDGSQTLWQEAKATTAAYTDDTFVAIYGYEMTWSGQYGHINTFNSVGFESRNNSTYVVRNGPGLTAYYDRLVEVAELDEAAGRGSTINQFNHPGTTFGTFEDFAHYSVAYDELITMIEVGNGEGKVGGSMYWPSYEYYTLALDKGWHLAPTNNQDNHKGSWGDSNTCRNVIYTDDFSEEGIYQAMRDLNIYATEDEDLEILYTLNGERMGSVLSLDESETLTISVEFNDPTDRVSKVSIIANGGVTVESRSFGTRSGTWEVEIPNTYSYYYIRIDGADAQIAVTSPVWTKEVTKIGISSVTKDTVVDLIDEPITFTTTLYNYEQQGLEVDKVAYYIDDVLRHTNNNEFTVAPETEDSSATWAYTPKAEGRFTMRVEVTAYLNDTMYVFTQSLSFTVRNGADMKTMLIDASHANFYVSGNYADSDTAFIELAAEYGVRSEHITDETGITDEVLEGCDLLVLTVPFRGASISVADVLYTDDEIAAIKKYADNGGNLIICSKSDRLEPTAQEEWASVISNELLEAVGAKARIGKGIVADVVNNTNESYRLHFVGKEFYNYESALCAYLPETTNSMFSCYNGAPVILNGATPVVTAFDTTFVSSYADYYTGSSYMPNPDTEKSTYYYSACGDQEDVVVVAEETLPGGGFCITAGVTFFSTFEVKVEVENAGTLQNTNYQIVCNLFEMLNPPTITPISEIMEDGKLNISYTIEGWVTSNASGYDQETAFFDCIYVQDESGRGINVFPVSGNYQIGQKVRVSGMTASYMGEIELNAGNEYGGKVVDITLPYAERVELIDIDFTLADRQTIDTYSVDTTRLQAELDTICAEVKNTLVEPVASAENMEILEDGSVQYPNQDSYLMDVVTCARAMSSAKLGGLVEIYGKVTKVEYDDNGVLGAIYVNDGSGTAIVFLDGYIDCDCENCARADGADYHDLSAVQVGTTVRVRGIASMGQNSYENSERIGSRIRIRNRADIEVWLGSIPKTGESITAIMWVGLVLILAAGACCGVVIARKKLRNTKA